MINFYHYYDPLPTGDSKIISQFSNILAQAIHD